LEKLPSPLAIETSMVR